MTTKKTRTRPLWDKVSKQYAQQRQERKEKRDEQTNRLVDAAAG